jgi:hypothetical protein
MKILYFQGKHASSGPTVEWFSYRLFWLGGHGRLKGIFRVKVVYHLRRKGIGFSEIE